ncbi:MAG: hypothetical protein EA417_00395 [Gammaproteobacteria bacterium]|nr:MAG: hypothetical protein EA417_00395 [Gammaproteobacteria bacterium]
MLIRELFEFANAHAVRGHSRQHFSLPTRSRFDSGEPLLTADSDAARGIEQRLRGAGPRLGSGVRKEKAVDKLRRQTIKRVPVLLLLSAEETTSGPVALPTLDQAAQWMAQERQRNGQSAGEASPSASMEPQGIGA